jgi:putative spermidine/putrescine transport system permease protein
MLNGSFRHVLTGFNALVILFVLSPILVVTASSFGETLYMRFPPQGFTFRWYEKALTDPAYWRAFNTSIYIGAITALVATAVGAAAAWALVRYSVRGRSAFESALLLPLTLPHLILGIAILTLTQPLGMGGSLNRLIIAHIVVTIPYVLRILVPVITELSAELEEAGADLGASPSVVFTTVTLPILLPSIVVCLAISFMVSFDELVLSLFLAPPAQRTIPIQIFSNVEFGLDPSVGALSTMLLAATFGLMLLGQGIARSLSVSPAARAAH